ncbi:MAG: acyltransferase [Candidatus Obscuribacterales bacterium]|nr:acyltransferase [Candidatus Obscuribacterales bacterium]
MQSLEDSRLNVIDQVHSTAGDAFILSDDKIGVKQNYQSVQVVRGLAALAVVWLHVGLMDNWDNTLPHIMTPFVRCGHAGVDAFFIVSGFVLATAHWNDFGRGKVIPFLLKRMIRIYPFLLVSSVPFLWLKYSAQHCLSSKTVAALLLAPRYAGTINPVAWSLAFEVVFYAAFACFLPFRRSILLPGMIAWAMLIAIYNTCPIGFPLNDCAYIETLLHPWSLEFIAGVLMAALIKCSVDIPAVPTMVMASIWLFVACLVRHVTASDDFTVNGWRCVWFGIPCFFLIYGLISLERTKRILRFPKLLLMLGDASYSIYLLHFALILFAQDWFQAHNTPISCIAKSLGCALLFPTLCIPFYYFLERPLLTFCKKTLRL